MRKIRRDNDFTYHWSIVRDGVPQDLTDLPKRLYLIHSYGAKEVLDYKTIGNTISIDFTSELLNKTGKYYLELHFITPDPTFESGQKECALDTGVCIIVGTTNEADPVSEFTTTTDMAFGFQGKSAYDIAKEGGYEGTYEDFKSSSMLIGTIPNKLESIEFSPIEYNEVLWQE